MVIVANVVKAPRHHALKLPHGYTWLGVSLGSHTDLRRAAVITLPTAYRVTWSIMGKREGSGVILVSIASSVTISAVVTLLMCSTSTMAAVSSSLNSAPLVVQIIGSSSAAFIALDADC
jgi:uncharacterized PurR-regulated membrane protein YhhQ (DUF165 family)